MSGAPVGRGGPSPGLGGGVGRVGESRGEKGRGRGPDCYRCCHGNRVTWQPRLRPWSCPLVPGVEGHTRPSFFKHPCPTSPGVGDGEGRPGVLQPMGVAKSRTRLRAGTERPHIYPRVFLLKTGKLRPRERSWGGSRSNGTPRPGRLGGKRSGIRLPPLPGRRALGVL